MRVWVNFKELRARLKFEEVLKLYKIDIRRKGPQHQGPCPLPRHTGSRESASFSANLDRGIFQCFGCGAKGNALEFAALMKGIDPQDGEALRSVAVEMQQRFFPREATQKIKSGTPTLPDEPKATPVVVNAPLNFELKGLDGSHPYLSGRGFTRETMNYFGVGYCSRGLLTDRVAIPLHDNDGKLLGYAGRVTDDAEISDSNPRYRLPSRREHSGTVYEFKKSLFLYNAFRAKERAGPLVILSGFPSVWWLTQNGVGRVVATMGPECSEEQLEQVLSLSPEDGQVWIMPDGNKAGERFAEFLLLRLSPHRLVRWVKLEEGRQPTDLTRDQLKNCLPA